MALPTFKEFVGVIKIIEESYSKTQDKCLEDFFDEIESHGLMVEDVTTSDIASVTLPIGMMPRKKPTNVAYAMEESAPPDTEIENWIKANKNNFKKHYGENWEKVLYAVAWRMFDKKHDV